MKRRKTKDQSSQTRVSSLSKTMKKTRSQGLEKSSKRDLVVRSGLERNLSIMRKKMRMKEKTKTKKKTKKQRNMRRKK